MTKDNSNINSRMEVRTVKVTRWRSIEQSLDEIKKLDPETAITVFLFAVQTVKSECLSPCDT